MLKSSTHNHTTFCDGQNTPEEMAEAAYALGFTDFGFSGHTYVDFADYGVKDELAYVRALTAPAGRSIKAGCVSPSALSMTTTIRSNTGMHWTISSAQCTNFRTREQAAVIR